MQEELNASKVFSSMTVFSMFQVAVEGLVSSWIQFITSKVSLDRVDGFLRKTELMGTHSTEKSVVVPHEHQDDIGFRNTVFSWSKPSRDSETTSSEQTRRFSLRIDDLVFRKGYINTILGPTGSGKTSLLLAMLGEMYFTPSSTNSWYNLPRKGGVAYAAQEAWIQSDTIKSNIVFNSEFDAERYKKVLHQCCLEQDLELFAAGDEQVVGERGLTLSGGQKARVSLARALYSHANILLLDDILAALDIQTAKWIVDKCFGGDLITGRTVLLVTHNIALTRSISQFTVSLGQDGRVVSQLSGSPQGSFEADAILHEPPKSGEKPVKPSVAEKKSPNNGKLFVAEETVRGSGWSPVQLYMKGLGGNHLHLFSFALLAGLAFRNLVGNLNTWYLGHWASQYDGRSASEVSALRHLGIYGSILFLMFLLYTCSFLLYTFGASRASKVLHRQLVESVLGATFGWLDTTPSSRIIARLTQDIGMVDSPIATAFWTLLDQTMEMLTTFGAIVLFTPVFFGPGICLFILSSYCGRIFMPARMSVRSEMGKARSPVLGHFAAAIHGLTSIRAYGCQEAFIDESLRRLDRYTRTARLSFDLSRWSLIRTSMLSNSFTAMLAVYIVYFQEQSAGNTGFFLHTAVHFSSTIVSWILCFNDVRLLSNSLERIGAYLNIEQEPKPTKEGIPPALWPASGELMAKNLSARYSREGAYVLHDISFTINSGERIGVVGKTGSGKSSLTLALLREIVTYGSVSFAGIETSTVNLDILRSKITVIPQMPELLTGKLRHNLDPFHQFEDHQLIAALRAAGLYSLQTDGRDGQITLDTAITSGGSNLSVGQRQIIALARAMVRRSKLLILDEATSSVDYQTDTVIQSSLRHQLEGVTVITVAHRLQSVMDADRIMVLDKGRIVEFDTPKNLLQIEDGWFHRLVDECEDRAALYEMAGTKM